MRSRRRVLGGLLNAIWARSAEAERWAAAAERGSLSRPTVKSHATAIYRQLNVTSRNAVERAHELGLI